MQFDSGHSKNVVSLEDYRQNRRPIFQLPDNYFDQFNRYLIPENYRVDSSGLYRCDDATDNDSTAQHGSREHQLVAADNAEVSVPLGLGRAAPPVALKVAVGASVWEQRAVEPVADHRRQRNQRQLVQLHRQLHRRHHGDACQQHHREDEEQAAARGAQPQGDGRFDMHARQDAAQVQDGVSKAV